MTKAYHEDANLLASPTFESVSWSPGKDVGKFCEQVEQLTVDECDDITTADAAVVLINLDESEGGTRRSSDVAWKMHQVIPGRECG